MKTTLRNFLSILLLPFVVTVVVPFALLNRSFNASSVESALASWLFRVCGLIFIAGGLALSGWCVNLFVRVGQGTLAPWDPTRSLVAVGPYRFVRNPMISGVLAILLGEAFLWHSWTLAAWSCSFFVINAIYFIILEEPGLEKRFGKSYRQYKANVPCWIPRRTSWTNQDEKTP